MTKQQGSEIKFPNPLEMSRTVTRIAEQSQRLVSHFLNHQMAEGRLGITDIARIGGTFLELTQQMTANPAKVVEAQMAFWQGYMELWRKSTAALFGLPAFCSSSPEPPDRRFEQADWRRSYLFDFIKQSYLLSARWLQTTVKGAEGIDAKTKKRLEFYTRQFTDALMPTNFPITNPEVLRATIESGGANLLQGLQQLLDDLERITTLDPFEPGKNIATTPSKVIFQNELMQLLQYEPGTQQVFAKPLLVIPPWINKFYILDLRPENSLIRWWVDQGFTVFVISWVDPDEGLAEKRFENYLLEGPLAALDVIEEATNQREVNTVGYCLGGTLLACTVAYLAAKGDTRVSSAAYLNTMLDFTHPGELEVLIDEEQITALEERRQRNGVYDSPDLAMTFNMLRANDLIWSLFVNNYLLGQGLLLFELLHWNSDLTHLPAVMHDFYLRNMYQRNLLKRPGGISLAGVPINLGKSDTPSFFLGAIEDHIVPWKSTYNGTRLFIGPVHFVLGSAGHVVSVINSPSEGKSGYWANNDVPASAEEWFSGAERKDGSWWPDWLAWVGKYAGAKVPARVPGASGLRVIEDGPGAYVKAHHLDE